MYFRYMPYLFLGVLGYVVGNMISAMRRGDLKKRMQASCRIAEKAERRGTSGLCDGCPVFVGHCAGSGNVLLWEKAARKRESALLFPEFHSPSFDGGFCVLPDRKPGKGNR